MNKNNEKDNTRSLSPDLGSAHRRHTQGREIQMGAQTWSCKDSKHILEEILSNRSNIRIGMEEKYSLWHVSLLGSSMIQLYMCKLRVEGSAVSGLQLCTVPRRSAIKRRYVSSKQNHSQRGVCYKAEANFNFLLSLLGTYSQRANFQTKSALKRM